MKIKLIVDNCQDVNGLLKWIERGVIYKTIKVENEKDTNIQYELIED